MKLFKRENTIKNLTFVGNRISDKTESILSKDISKLKLQEISHLLRESIATQTCINISTEKLNNLKIDFDFYFNNKSSEEYRELLRELVLVNERNWDLNVRAYEKILGKISSNSFALKLPEYIINKFKYYKPKKLEWNESSVNNFNAYMNDNRTGVTAAYNMVHSLKIAVLNGTKIFYKINDKEQIITSLTNFENTILKSIECNEELKSMLEKEKTNANNVYN